MNRQTGQRAQRAKPEEIIMTISELDENGQQFLNQLFEQTRGDTSAQVSMYDVGKDIGMDRDTSSRVAEILIGLNWWRSGRFPAVSALVQMDPHRSARKVASKIAGRFHRVRYLS